MTVGEIKEINNVFPATEGRTSGGKGSGSGPGASIAERVEDTTNQMIGDIGWPKVTATNAMLQISGFAKRDVLESHGGSAEEKDKRIGPRGKGSSSSRDVPAR